GREEISRALAVPVARLDGLLQAQPRTLSLDDKVGKDPDLTVLDHLADDRTASPEEELSRRQDRLQLRQALRWLSGRQLLVIVARFGLDGGGACTLAEIGERLGVSREAVRQVEVQARRRLRKAMARRVAAVGLRK